MIIHAVASDDNTKTVLKNGSIYWMQGDEINVFYGNQSSGKFTTMNSVPAPSADFIGTISVVEGIAESSSEPSSFWGVYPYDPANTCDGSNVFITIPSNQEAAEGTFANGLNPAIAKSYGLRFSFYNVGSWFVFTVSQSGILSATLRGNNGESITGRVKVSMDSNNRPECTILQGNDYITMQAPTGGFVPGKEYRMVLIPQTLNDGYSLTFQKGGAYATFSNNNTLLFARNGGRGKLNADQGLIFSGNIPFADEGVKELCVHNWDVNHDGELSFEEAAAVTDLGTFFKGTDITSFIELQYFIGLTSIPAMAFQGCSQLTSITIPNTVEIIDDNAFSACSSLQRITIPSNVTAIGSNSFSDGASPVLIIDVESLVPPSLGTDALFTGGAIVVHVPEESYEDYVSAAGWKTYAASIFSSAQPEYVDMGLSVKWAKCNVGAATVDMAGNYYAWGSLAPQNTQTTDNTNKYQGVEETLPASRDIASVAFESTWRIPSKAEWQELRDNTTWEYINSGGRTGYVVTSTINGASLFLPEKMYWTNDSHSESSAHLANVSGSSGLVFSWQNRRQCLSIRPVIY